MPRNIKAAWLRAIQRQPKTIAIKVHDSSCFGVFADAGIFAIIIATMTVTASPTTNQKIADGKDRSSDLILAFLSCETNSCQSQNKDTNPTPKIARNSAAQRPIRQLFCQSLPASAAAANIKKATDANIPHSK